MTDQVRFVLSDDELAMAGAVLRGEPGANGHAPRAPLPPALASALATLADPRLSVAVTRLRPGDARVATMALAGDGKEGFAVHGGTSAAHDIIWLESREAVALHLGDFLDLTRPPVPGQAQQVLLSRDAWGALAAIADCLRESRLEAALSRRAPDPPLAVETDKLARLFAEGIASDDSSWAVACARVMALPESSLDDVDLVAGVAFLAGVGFVDAETVSLTAPGLAAANDLSTALSWGQAAVRFTEEGADPRGIVTFRAPVGAWSLEADAGTGLLRLSQVDSGAVLVKFLELLKAAPPPAAVFAEPQPPAPANEPAKTGFCPRCGRERRPGTRFCGGCGSAFAG